MDHILKCVTFLHDDLEVYQEFGCFACNHIEICCAQVHQNSTTCKIAIYCHTASYVCSQILVFIKLENLLPGIMDLCLVYFSVWGTLQQNIYCQKIKDINDLKHVL